MLMRTASFLTINLGSMLQKTRIAALLSVGLLLTLLLASCDSADSIGLDAGPAAANPRACEVRNNDTVDKLTECVTLDGVRRHQAAFQAIADANGGTRKDDSPGYVASVDYVVQTLEAAGWEVDRVPFTYPGFDVLLRQLSPSAADYETGQFTGTGEGDVTGIVIAVDLALDDPAASTSACETSDFDGLDFSGPNDIALIQRGVCFFSVKATNAEAAGAEAVVIMNQGTPGREGLAVGTAANLPDGSPSNLGIPVVGASFATGQALAQPGASARVKVDAIVIESENVIAEKAGETGDDVIMVGAHLDSVPGGPGINDNGSGSAAILEMAVKMEKLKPVNTIRLAWWGAEELGLIGSTQYVDNLSSAELDAIALYLNFDMIASPNFGLFIYDGDDSDGVGAGPGPAGSAEIEAYLESFYEERGYPYRGTDFSGRSDYGPFIAVGIPAGGLFTGAEGIKQPGDVALWGGSAGDQFDPCYHLACDTFDNVSLVALDLNADAVAAATLTFAMTDLPATAAPRTAPSDAASRDGQDGHHAKAVE